MLVVIFFFANASASAEWTDPESGIMICVVFLDSYAALEPRNDPIFAFIVSSYIIVSPLWSCNCANYKSCQIVCCMFKLHYGPQKKRPQAQLVLCTNTKSKAQKAMSIFYSNWPNIQKPRAGHVLAERAAGRTGGRSWQIQL